MSLPSIYMPAGLPCFLAEGHQLNRGDAYGSVDRGSGAARRRRTRTLAPRTVQVGLDLSAKQMASFYAWFEDVLLAGARRFVAKIGAEDGRLLYFDALWVSPYRAEPRAAPGGKPRWRVTGSISLRGDGETALTIDPSFEFEVLAELAAQANLIPDATVAFEVVAQLLPGASVEFEVVATLVTYTPGGYELREDGSRELREDSSYELRN